MRRCTAITGGGTRCKGIAIDGFGLCHAHHPDRAEQRKRYASRGGKRGGRGRPAIEATDIKTRLSGLAEDVLAGRVDRADAAVAGQLMGTVIRAIGMELKVRELEEFEERLEALEARGGGR